MASSDERIGAELEVTPEMVTAGVRSYLKNDLAYCSDEEMVAAVYRAMKFAELLKEDQTS